MWGLTGVPTFILTKMIYSACTQCCCLTFWSPGEFLHTLWLPATDNWDLVHLFSTPLTVSYLTSVSTGLQEFWRQSRITSFSSLKKEKIPHSAFTEPQKNSKYLLALYWMFSAFSPYPDTTTTIKLEQGREKSVDVYNESIENKSD